MPYLKSLPEKSTISKVFQHFNLGFENPFMEFSKLLMSSENSVFTIGERELMASYVSAHNSCSYCTDGHNKIAVSHGIKEGLLEQLIENPETAEIEARFLPIFSALKKLIHEQYNFSQEDVDSILSEGWSEQAVYEMIMICGFFNLTNRFAAGLGLHSMDHKPIY